MGKGLTGPQIATVQAFVGNHKSMPLFDHTFSLKPDYLSLKIQGRNGLVLKQLHTAMKSKVLILVFPCNPLEISPRWLDAKLSLN